MRNLHLKVGLMKIVSEDNKEEAIKKRLQPAGVPLCQNTVGSFGVDADVILVVMTDIEELMKLEREIKPEFRQGSYILSEQRMILFGDFR